MIGSGSTADAAMAPAPPVRRCRPLTASRTCEALRATDEVRTRALPMLNAASTFAL